MPLTKLDWDLVSARVDNAQVENRLKTRSQAFLWLVLSQYFPSQETNFRELITDGPDDRGVDAIHIIGNDDSAKIFIFQAKCRENIANTNKTINVDEVLKISHFISEIYNKSSDLAQSNNLRLRESVKQIWSLHEAGTHCSYEIVFCSNDDGIAPAAIACLDSFVSQYVQVGYSYYGANELIRDIGRGRSAREDGSIQFIAREIFERADGDIRGVVASVDAKSYIDLILNTDRRTVKRHLFDDNMRVFLGINAGYNGNIFETATSTDSHLFWYLNNGITITCRNYSYNKGHVSPKLRIEGFQIVNGAQTSHSLVEAWLINPNAIENVVLNVRVYATARDDVAERVAVATNSQARIQGRDLRANHNVMKKFELAFLQKGIYFERKRGMHSDRDVFARLDALKLGQIIMSFYLLEPDKARTESDSIFDNRFHQIFNESYDIDEIIAVVQLYARIEQLRETFLSQFGDSVENSGEYQYLVYGHWFILFAARLLLQQKNQKITSLEEFPQLIDSALSLVARACDQTKQVAHYQMFRSPRTREKILAELNGKQLELFP